MKAPFRVLGVLCLSIALGDAGVLMAQETAGVRLAAGPYSGLPVADTRALAVHAKGEKPPRAYGVDDLTRISLYSYAFQGLDPFHNVILDDGYGYRTFTVAADAMSFLATISIPAGASIEEIGFHNCDNTDAGGLEMRVYDNFGDHDYELVGSVNSTSASFCGYNSASLTPYHFDSNDQHVVNVVIFQTIVDPTLKFRDAYVRYRRRVSPAPGTPIFNDVPLDDFGFPYIAALVNSGITGGTGGGNYSPDAFVTRRQMAIFIAKALGLSWSE